MQKSAKKTVGPLNLHALAEELTKQKPDGKKVKSLMLAAGLPFSADPLEQMTICLQKLNQLKPGNPPDEMLDL